MSVFSAPPVKAPMLLSGEGDLPDVTESAMNALTPVGVMIPGQTLRPKAFVAGNLKLPDRTPRVNLVNTSYENLSLAADRLWTRLTGGKPSKQVIVTTADPAFKRFALPAGHWRQIPRARSSSSTRTPCRSPPCARSQATRSRRST